MVRFAGIFTFGLQCLSGGASSLEDEVVLLQAHAHQSLKPKHSSFKSPTHAREESAHQLVQTYENMVRDVMARGPNALPTDAVLNPAISQFDTLKVELTRDQATQQDLVNQANAALTACNSNKEAAFSEADVGVDARKAAADTKRSTHEQCRSDENSKSDTKDQKCNSFNALAGSHQCASETWLTANGQALVDAAKECTSAQGAHGTVAPQCDHDQRAFEEHFCAYASKLKLTCETYSTCRTDETERRSAVYTESEELEASHKRIWTAYEKAVCFLNLLKDARSDGLTEAKLKACLDLVPDASALDVTYPAPCDEQACDTSPVSSIPGEDAWRAAEYGVSPYSDQPGNLEATDACPEGAVQVPDNFLHKCAHDADWDYVLDYGDDRNVDDIPDDRNAIAAGFSNSNAYYIGNVELAKLDLAEVEVCSLVSSMDCNRACFTLSDPNDPTKYQYRYADTSDNCCPECSTQLQKAIAMFSGQCAEHHWIMLNAPNQQFSHFQAPIQDVNWACGGHRLFYTHTGNAEGWHAQGWGISLQIKGHMQWGSSAEFGWYSSHCPESRRADVDVLQIRIKTN